MKISGQLGLEVVVPAGFDREKIPDLLKQKKEWIEKSFRKLGGEGISNGETRLLPDFVHLKAVGKRFAVRRKIWSKGAFQLRQSDDSLIVIYGDAARMDICERLLNRWLKLQGRLRLIPWLEEVSAETGLVYRKAQVRQQRSRWGSCSSKGAISLNCNLLFLAPELVRYVLIHELCHTVHRNHSASFWSLLEEMAPGCMALDKELNGASREVPAWAR